MDFDVFDNMQEYMKYSKFNIYSLECLVSETDRCLRSTLLVTFIKIRICINISVCFWYFISIVTSIAIIIDRFWN